MLITDESVGEGALRPLVVITPIIAETIAKAGWSKADVKRYLFEHARLPAWEFERYLRDWTIRGTHLCMVRLELLRKLNAIEGIHIPEDRIAKAPSVKLADLAAPGRVDEFLRIYEWMIKEIAKSV